MGIVIRRKPIQSVRQDQYPVSHSPFKKIKDDVIKRNIDNIGKGGDFPSYIKNIYQIFDIKDEEMNFIRILPPRDDDPFEDFLYPIWIHSYLPVDGSFVCIEKMKLSKERCPICDAYRTVKSFGNDELAKNLAPKERFLFQVIDTSDKPQSDGLLILDTPSTLKNQIIDLCHPPRKGLYNVSDPEEGREVVFKRQQVAGKKYPQYTSAQLGDEIKIDSSYSDIIVHFEDILFIPPYSDLVEISKYLIPQTQGGMNCSDSPGKERISDRHSEIPIQRKLIIRRKVS